MNRLVVILLAFVLWLPAKAQTVATEPDRLADDFVQVSLVIAEPGDVLYSVLGHACLHLQCPYYDLDYIYSYESEDVRGKVGRFLLNDLKMAMIAIPVEEYLEPFRQEGRGVREYVLCLPPQVKTELWRILDEKLMEATVSYDYIKRGCAISVLHSLLEALGDTPMEFPAWGKAFDRTLREIVYDNSPVGWQRFYGMTLVGGEVDNPDLPRMEKLIIPRELLAALQQTRVEGQTLAVAEPVELLPTVNAYKGDRFTPLHASLLVLLLAIGSLFWKRPYIDWAILALQTLLGVLMTWLLISPLPGTEWSWLFIPFNPLPLLFWHWRRYWALPYAVLMLAWIIGVLCAPHRLVETAHIVLVLAFVVVVLKPWLRKMISKILVN